MPMNILRKLPAALLLGPLLAAPALAQIHVPMYTGTPLLITGGVLNQQVLRNAERQHTERTAAAVAVVAPEATPKVPRELASHYPAAERDKAERLFADLLQRYRGIEEQFAIPRRDLGGALASFIAGSYIALHNRPLPDEHFAALVRQMRHVIAADPRVARAPAAERQQAFEQLAILGLFMAGAQRAQQQQPDAEAAARLHRAAGDYLQQLLAVDPARVHIGAQGLSLTGP
jgi:hypothetical protein